MPTHNNAAGQRPTCLARHYRFRGQFRAAGRGLDHRIGSSRRLQAAQAVDRPTHKLKLIKACPWGRDGISLLTPGKIHRSGPTRQEEGEGRGVGGAAAEPVETSRVPRCVSDTSATTQEGDKQGLACRPSVARASWLNATVARVECTCGR